MTGDSGSSKAGRGNPDGTATRAAPAFHGLARFRLAGLWQRLMSRYRPERNYMRGASGFSGSPSSLRDDD